MNNNDKLNEIVKRLHGDLFVGCIGSIRCGKSTFINRFMNIKILPNINDGYLKNKIIDELPQTSPGKQIMTVEPKFVPTEALNVNIGNINMNLRMVDSVGYVIDSALGYKNDDGPRLVKTPWFDEAIPFLDAAKIGTEKIMENHCNLGIVLTSDGSFNDFTKEEYDNVLDEVIMKMKTLDKPFVIVLNTINKDSEDTKEYVLKLEEKYNESVYACNVLNMTEEDIDQIFSLALEEFKIESLTYKMPSYLENLKDIKLYKDIDNIINESNIKCEKVKDVSNIINNLKELEQIDDVSMNIDGGNILVDININYNYIKLLINELSGKEITSQADLINVLYEGKKALKLERDYGNAIKQCLDTGYGVSIGNVEDMKLLPPTVIKQSGRYGVKVEAIAPSIHLIKVDVKSSFSPIIGSLEQSKMLIDSLEGEDDSKIWDKEIFGRKLNEIVNDGIKQKIYSLPEGSKEKLKDVMNKLINSQRNSLIAIVL